MRTLITGGAGFVGSHLSDELLWRGHRVHIIDDLSMGATDKGRWAYACDRGDRALAPRHRDGADLRTVTRQQIEEIEEISSS